MGIIQQPIPVRTGQSSLKPVPLAQPELLVWVRLELLVKPDIQAALDQLDLLVSLDQLELLEQLVLDLLV